MLLVLHTTKSLTQKPVRKKMHLNPKKIIIISSIIVISILIVLGCVYLNSRSDLPNNHYQNTIIEITKDNLSDSLKSISSNPNAANIEITKDNLPDSLKFDWNSKNPNPTTPLEKQIVAKLLKLIFGVNIDVKNTDINNTLIFLKNLSQEQKSKLVHEKIHQIHHLQSNNLKFACIEIQYLQEQYKIYKPFMVESELLNDIKSYIREYFNVHSITQEAIHECKNLFTQPLSKNDANSPMDKNERMISIWNLLLINSVILSGGCIT